MEAFGRHATNGMILYTVAAVLLVLGLLAMSGWKAWVIPLVIGILLFVVQGMLLGLAFSAEGSEFEVTKWWGGLHACDGMVITAGFVWLYVDRLRHPLKKG